MYGDALGVKAGSREVGESLSVGNIGIARNEVVPIRDGLGHVREVVGAELRWE